MTDIAFHRTQTAVRFLGHILSAAGIEFLERFDQPVNFHRIAQMGSGSVGFDIAHRIRLNVCLFIGIDQ